MGIILGILMKPIHWMFSFVFGIIAFIILLFLAVALTFNHWIPTVGPWLLGRSSGFDLHLGKSQSNVFTMRFDFRDLTIRNGENFPVPQFVEMEQFRADLLLLSLLTKKVIVEDFTLHIPRLTCVKTGDGRTNVEEFLAAVGPPTPRSGEGGKRTAQPTPRKILFRNFDLSIDRVVFMDYTADPVRVLDIPVRYSLVQRGVDAEALFKRITADLRSRGLPFLRDSLIHALVGISDRSPAMKANGIGPGGAESEGKPGKSLLQKMKAKFQRGE